MRHAACWSRLTRPIGLIVLILVEHGINYAANGITQAATSSNGGVRDCDRNGYHCFLDRICSYKNPELNVTAWARLHSTPALTDCSRRCFAYSDEERQRHHFGIDKYLFDVVVSDRIGPRRTPPDTRHPLCQEIEYNVSLLPNASIVLIYHNEALSVLVRMIDGIYERTPASLIHEIVLLDDFSDESATIEDHVRSYGMYADWPMERIRFARNERRHGLIRSKVYAARMATGAVLVFLDSHCEVNQQWLEPLLTRILKDKTRVVLPVIDYIHPETFEYEELMVGTIGFNWNLMFTWDYPPYSYYEADVNRRTLPLRSPAMSGGLLAIDKAYFHSMGEYDTGMDIWGAENIEMSLRIWMCGGSVEVMPCSRVGHVFRIYRPYTNPNNTDYTADNNIRTALVWMDDYKEKLFEARPQLRQRSGHNISERLDLRRKLNCRDFQWYLDNVYPELKDKSAIVKPR